MTQISRADVMTADDANDSAPIKLKSFLVACVLCSVVGLTVMAILAQAMVAYLAPAG